MLELPKSTRPLILTGNVYEIVKDLSNESISCIITSPPYWGLRDYDLESIVFGGSDSCEHKWGCGDNVKVIKRENSKGDWDRPSRKEYDKVGSNFKCVVCGNEFKGKLGQKFCSTKCLNTLSNEERNNAKSDSSFCSRCGAWRGSLGLENHPQMFIDHLVELFELLKPKLRDDSNIYVNLGDTYFGSGAGHKDTGKSSITPEMWPRTKEMNKSDGGWLQDRQLLMIPSRFAIAMQDKGWILRNFNIWEKINPMPSSVKSRRNNVWEAVFHFVKNTKSLWSYNTKTMEMVDRKPKELVEGRDWGWRECSYCSDYKQYDEKYIDKNYKSSIFSPKRIRETDMKTKRKIKISNEDAESFGSPRARYHRDSVRKDCKRCGGTGKVKQSYWHNYSYFYDLDSIREPHKESSIERNKYQWNSKQRTHSPNEKRGIDHRKPGKILHELLKYNSKYEKSDYGQSLQGFVRTQSIAKGREMSHVEAREMYPNDPKKQQEYINWVHDHGGHSGGRNPGDVIRHKWEDVPGQEPQQFSRKRHSGYFDEDGNLLINPLGRNPGDILRITTQPYKEAHFSTYPEELCRPLIESSCPREICISCGKVRERITKTEYKHHSSYQGDYKKGFHGRSPSGFKDVSIAERETIGWTKCNCEPQNYEPGIVFDPFMGSGTTMLVARRLGRRSIGVEMNLDYVKMARKRLKLDYGDMFSFESNGKEKKKERKVLGLDRFGLGD